MSFWDMYSFSNGETLLPLITWVVTLGCIFLLSYLIFVSCDEEFGSKHNGKGFISKKKYHEAYTTITMIYNAASKSSTPITNRHPERWTVKIVVNNQAEWVDVSKKYFQKCEKNDEVEVDYFLGRWTGDLYIQAFY